MSRVVIFKPQVCGTIWYLEFVGDLVLVNRCPFEGGDVGQSMHWHTERVMRMMFRSWSLTARYEELKLQAGNRPIVVASMRKHQLVQAAATKLLWSRERVERETVGHLRLTLWEFRQEKEEFQVEREKLLPLGWKWLRAEEIKELAMERNNPLVDPTGSPRRRRR